MDYQPKTATIKRFETRQEAPVKTFCRFGPLHPADYNRLSAIETETPRPTPYVVLGVDGDEVELLVEHLTGNPQVGERIPFLDLREARARTMSTWGNNEQSDSKG